MKSIFQWAITRQLFAQSCNTQPFEVNQLRHSHMSNPYIFINLGLANGTYAAQWYPFYERT